MDEDSQSWLWQLLCVSPPHSSGVVGPAPDDVPILGISTAIDKNPGNPDRHRFEDLVQAILFSRRFIPTYNVILFGVLAILIIEFRVRRFQYRRQSEALARAESNYVATDSKLDTTLRIEHIHRGISSSSASSSSAGGATTPDVTASAPDDERKPLLIRHVQSSPRKTRSTTGLLKSWLMYQPNPISILNKDLPSNGTSLVVLVFFLLNVFYLFFRLPLGVRYIFVFADRTGLLFAVNLPLLYLLGAKNQPLTWLAGRSYESLNIFHRRLGEMLCFLALLHASGKFLAWGTLLRPIGFPFLQFLFSRLVLFGLGAFVCYELIFLTSLRSFRQRFYEAFLVMHVILQAGALLFLSLHHRNARPYTITAFIIFTVDRLLFRLLSKTATIKATLTVLPDGNTVLLSSNWDIPENAKALKWLPRSPRYGWTPASHVFLTIPALSHIDALQAHPFTIFSGAPSTTDAETSAHAWFSLLIRSYDGFSRSLLNYALEQGRADVRIDGPYGSSHALDMLSASRVRIVIAGGSGISVAYPLLWELVKDNIANGAEIVSTSSSASIQHDVDSCETRYVSRNGIRTYLLWITRSDTHSSWLSEPRLLELCNGGVNVVIPPPTERAGRVDINMLLTSWIQDAGRKSKTSVVISGPDSLNRDGRNVCARLIGEGWDVSFAAEKFGW